MGVFQYDNKYAAPTKVQRERYMNGGSEEYLFGPDGQIMLIEYREVGDDSKSLDRKSG